MCVCLCINEKLVGAQHHHYIRRTKNIICNMHISAYGSRRAQEANPRARAAISMPQNGECARTIYWAYNTPKLNDRARAHVLHHIWTNEQQQQLPHTTQKRSEYKLERF